MNWRATISLRKAFPIWAMPKGIFILPVFWTFRKFTKMPCAVSGRRYILLAPSAVDPISVANIRLNCLTSVQFLVPETGHTISLSIIICLSSVRSVAFSAFEKRIFRASYLAWFSSTLWFVSLNFFSSNEAPNLSLAFSISLFIFSSSLARCSSIRTSALYLFLESLLSIRGSLKASTCPEAFQMVGCMNIAESMPTIFSLSRTMLSHQYFLMLFFSSTPYWP